MSFESDQGRRQSVSRTEQLADPETWPLLYETLRNMERQQLLGVLERQARHLVFPRLPVDFDERYDRRVPPAPNVTTGPIRTTTARLRQSLSESSRQSCADKLETVENGGVTFLQTTVDVATDDGVEWFHREAEQLPALWQLKLHGFEFLEWAYLAHESAADAPEVHSTLAAWLRDWTRSPATRIGARRYLRRAWTPHAVSLRILNATRYYAWCERTADEAFLRELRRSIYKNALFLENHVEHDVGGNHLIENGVALVVAGVLFQEGNSFRSTGLSVLVDATEQFLRDGGHFERSPMYHVIALTRYLTTLSVLEQSNRQPPDALLDATESATRFLRSIRPPDGELPLLNDSVHGQALALDSCLAYARRLDARLLEAPARSTMPETGYYWLGDGDDRLLVDGGPFGPPHLPAHSHNDLFSILLWVEGQQLLTDTGTYHYAADPRRQHSRSVRAHNTVQVGDSEPIPIGGQYLAGRRLDPTVEYASGENRTVFEGLYRRETAPEYSHRRRITSSDGWWLVRDTVRAERSEPISQRLHFHPSVELTGHPSAADGFALSLDGRDLAYLLPVGADRIIRRSSPYFPEFRREQTRPAVAFERDQPGTMRFLLSTDPVSPEEYSRLASAVAGREVGPGTEQRSDTTTTS